MRVLVVIVFVISALVVSSTAVLFWRTRETADEILLGRALDRARDFARSAKAPNVDDGVLDYLSAGLEDRMVKSACIYMPGGTPLGTHASHCAAHAYEKTMIRKVVEADSYRTTRSEDNGVLKLWFPISLGTGLVDGRTATRLTPGPTDEELRVLLLEVDPSSVDALILQNGVHTVLITLLVALLMGVTLRQVRLITKEQVLEKELNEQKRFADLGRLSAVLAHEIRNPLGAIKGFAQYAMERLKPGDQRREDMETIVGESLRLERLTKSLLLYARPVEPTFRTRDLKAFVGSAVKLTALAAKENGVALEVNLAEGEILARIDEEQLTQAVLNILGNGVEAMEEGGRLRVSLEKDGGRAVLAVSDTGVGIDPAVMPEIFEPYVTKKANGTGLGLSVARRIIRAHGGEITVSSESGKGSVFTVLLPLESDDA